ncbi:MAG: phospholipase D-like domain-containing protein, partial [Actinomycetota bacterium]|nr:phospholipase D-like domain-containing protein [Actinomycetota bacterium]
YELADPIAERDLVAAARRGVTVRVILDGGSFARAKNAGAFAYLRAHGVHVRWSPRYFRFTHQKTMTVDRRRSLIMTLNLTARYYATTRDFAFSDARSADVGATESVFGADWAGRPIVASKGSGDLLWSPGAEGALVSLIDGAHASLEVENEEMADQPVLDALCRAARRGVRVRVVMTYASDWVAAFARLAQCGASVHAFHGETPLYIHAKEIVADGVEAFLGSQNFSYTSLERNRELGVITTSGPVLSSLQATFDGDYRRAPAVGRRAPP